MKGLISSIVSWVFALTICIQGVLAGPAPSVKARASSNSPQETLGYSRSLDFRVKLLSPLSTKTNKKGDKVSAQVITPEEYAGDFLEGTVTESKSGKSIKGTSVLTFVFHTLHHRNEPIRVEASIKSFKNSKGQEQVDEEGNVIEKKNNTSKVVAGSIIGGVLGAIFGGAKGAVIGSGAGAALAIVLVKFAVKGASLSFDPGSEFVVEAYRSKHGEGAAGNDLRPSTPPSPSASYTTYSGSFFSLSIPSNWRGLSGSSELTFAPENGYGYLNGQLNIAYGILVGSTPAQSRNLREATGAFTQALTSGNPNLRVQTELSSSDIGSRYSLAMTFSNYSDLTKRAETVGVYTTFLNNGSLFYIITVAPNDEYDGYSDTFLRIIRSIRIGD